MLQGANNMLCIKLLLNTKQVSPLNCVQLFTTPWTAACQASPHEAKEIPK